MQCIESMVGDWYDSCNNGVTSETSSPQLEWRHEKSPNEKIHKTP